jgi:Fis family transcriptional regulator
MDLQTSVKLAISQYFMHLDGANANNIYALVLDKVEKPLLEVVMQHANNNQTQAAKWLGLSRNTLKKLLQKHNI